MEPPVPEPETCAACGRDLKAFGPPAQHGEVWICVDCDAAGNVALERAAIEDRFGPDRCRRSRSLYVTLDARI